MPSYLNALEIQLDMKLQKRGAPFFSVYFGGGTPSLIPIGGFEKIFKKISNYIDETTEITVEANPSSWSLEKACALKDMGVNRVSLGLQSLNGDKLHFLSRAHDAKEAIKSFEISRAAGYDNISVDFMYDTPFDDREFAAKELASFLKLGAEHISAYSLTIEDGTPFASKNIKTRYDPDIAREIANTLISHGYEHYEVASFGRIRSKHNFGYWEYREYLGVGAGAVGFDGDARYYPYKSIESYIAEPTHEDVEPLSKQDVRLEKILLGLRSKVGVEKEVILNKKNMQTLLEGDFLRENTGRIYAKDLFLADELASRLA